MFILVRTTVINGDLKTVNALFVGDYYDTKEKMISSFFQTYNYYNKGSNKIEKVNFGDGFSEITVKSENAISIFKYHILMLDD